MQSTLVEMQCQLADTSQDLLLEVTALRARVNELTRMMSQQELTIRSRLEKDFNVLVQNMFCVCYEQMGKFDEFVLVKNFAIK